MIFQMKTKTTRKRVSALLIAAFLASVIGISPMRSQALTLNNPPTRTTGVNAVTWDCVWFGSYPQTEVEATNELENADYDANNDTIIAHVKYRRVQVDENWHYFRYDPIKWRVLLAGSSLSLLADQILDTQPYHDVQESTSWEESTVRSWLNGHDSSKNSSGIDYTSDNFIDTAFSSDEQESLLALDNSAYIIYTGEDKVNLLQATQAAGIAGRRYGFLKDASLIDYARMASTTAYAAALGAANDWWVVPHDRGTPISPYPKAFVVNSGGCFGEVVDSSDIGLPDEEVSSLNHGIRPAIYLNADCLSCSYAGTVSMNGTVNEEIPGQIPLVEPTPTPDPTPSEEPTPDPAPSDEPSSEPSSTPTPSNEPSSQPSSEPSMTPSSTPNITPTPSPVVTPSSEPSSTPNITPTPSSQPSSTPNVAPTPSPVVTPSSEPSSEPSSTPSVAPTPSSQPSSEPNSTPSVAPTPSSVPSITPSTTPTPSPVVTPSSEPSSKPSSTPSAGSVSTPTPKPSSKPSVKPSTRPSVAPIILPTIKPGILPSVSPGVTSSPNPTKTPEPAKNLPKKGAKKTIGILKYIVLRSSKTNGTVAVYGTTKKNAKKLSIPDTVKLNGYTFTVVRIKNSAFKKMKKLSEVTIGSNITKIGKRAFANCTALSLLHIETSKLKSLGAKAFQNTASRISISAPTDKQKTYIKMFTNNGKMTKHITTPTP